MFLKWLYINHLVDGLEFQSQQKSYCLIIFLPINLLVIQKLLIWTESKILLFSFFLSQWVCAGVLRFFWSSQSDVSHTSAMYHTSPRSCLVVTLLRYIILGFQQELGESGDLTMRFRKKERHQLSIEYHSIVALPSCHKLQCCQTSVLK